MANLQIVDVIIKTGQSVNAGTIAIGGSGPFPVCPWWGLASAAFSSMVAGTPANDVALAQALEAAKRKCCIINISQGGTSSLDWTPPSGAAWVIFAPKFVNALAALPAQFPAGTVFRYWHSHDQGESDTTLTLAQVNNWATVFESIHSNIVQMVGQAMPRIITLTKDPQPVNTLLSALRAQQVIAAQTPSHYINRDIGSGVTYGADTIHPDLPGYLVLGAMQGNVILGLDTMGTLSATALSALVDHQNNKAAYSPEATHYIHWYAGGVALTNGNSPGYVKNTSTNNTTTWPNASSRIKSNGVAFTQTPSGTGLSPDEVRITNNATEGAGTVLASDTFTPVAWSVATGPVSIAIGAFTITAATNVAVGGFTDSVVHSLYNLMFGAVAYTQLVTTFLSYWAGDPAGAGTIAGGSVALTQASQWGSAVSGQAQSILSVSLAQQVTGTYFAIHDTADGGGVLLMTCTRAASIGASGTILAGQLLTTML
jgi:hypothetical protein